MPCWKRVFKQRRGGATLIFLYIPKLGHFFKAGGGGGGGGVGVNIFIYFFFYFFFWGGGGQEKWVLFEGVGYEDFVDIFGGSSQKLTSFSFFSHWYDRMRSLRQGVCMYMKHIKKNESPPPSWDWNHLHWP